MYVELRAHTAFSFGDGAMTPEQLVCRAKELGYSAIGITDHADFGGVARFAQKAEIEGIKPVVGAELNVDGYPVALLVRDAEGCKNLAGLITRSRTGHLEDYKKIDNKITSSARPRGYPNITWAQLAERSAGLHALTGPASGMLASLLLAKKRNEAIMLLSHFRELFGDKLAVEVQLHDLGGQEAELASELIQLANMLHVPWVVCNNPRYLDANGRMLHDILTALSAGVDIDSAMRQGILHPSGDWKLHTPQFMSLRWAGREEGLRESVRIAEECSFNLKWLRPPLPKFPVPDGHNDDSYLREKVYDGARLRWNNVDDNQRRQIEHELRVIQNLGFAGFFLVMWDAVQYARMQRILCQGRGSAANSAVAYCLGITAVDPVKNGLLFERFLSDTRVHGVSEAPDIDVDIEHDRREEVLDFMYQAYGRPYSAITCTVQTYQEPNAIRDVTRALGYANEAAIKAFDGLPRLRSTHVGGFVLSSQYLGDYLPIEHTSMGRTIIQFDKDDLDIIGVPKFDFLGLGALSMVRRSFDSIELRTGVRPELYSLPADDKKTYDMISTGETIGTFQIESRAQIASILHTQPEILYDIVVQISLVRPGPIQANFVHPYTNRRRGKEDVMYLDPRLEPILKRTYGIPIFQEQAMAISVALGGFSNAEADELRRAMGNIRKKGRLVGVLDKLKLRMQEHGVSVEVAEKIGNDLLSFANYGFPESHAWSFALIAYATAYLKTHYPTDFFLGILNSWPMGFYPPSTLIHEARRHGVDVLPPCLRDGDWECATVSSANTNNPQLRIGWRHIRGVGSELIDKLRYMRDAAPFRSIEDVVQRTHLKRSDALALARAGALAAWEPDRNRAGWEALRAAGDNLPFAPSHSTDYKPPEMTRRELILLDYFSTGICVHGHPMEDLRARLKRKGVHDSESIKQARHGETIQVAGLVTVRQRPESAKGTIFLLLEDEWGFINVIVSPALVEKYNYVVKHAPFILIEGKFERDGRVMNVVGNKFHAMKVESIALDSHDFH